MVRIDATSLSRVFSAPMWLRDLGLLAGFLVGVAIVLVGVIVLLGLTSTIVLPVTVGAILATVAGPLVTKMSRRMPRVAAALIVLLANGLLQNIVQPIAFGATLELNPLVVLIVTIGFGSIFGTLGMILAAPLTSAAVHISKELA